MTTLADELLKEYGPALSTKDLAKIFSYKSPKSVQEAIYRGTFPDPDNLLETKKIGSRIFADYMVVADYLENIFGKRAANDE